MNSLYSATFHVAFFFHRESAGWNVHLAHKDEMQAGSAQGMHHYVQDLQDVPVQVLYWLLNL